MTFTQIGALIGTVTGVASLAWNIYTKVSAGPKLRVQAWAGMVKRPAPKGDSKFLKVTIQNVGNQPTTITNYGFFQYATKQDRKRRKPETAAVLVDYEGDHYPHKLEVGGEAQILMQQDLSFDRALAEKTVYFAVWHAFSKHPIEVAVINPKFEKKENTAQAGN
ncbi:MAG TPA: hypothetical protein VFR24_21980 [Candidatus Angelobacter sp.]|nr:hypothetical protein [Candidatus Angelobacter sp.]